MKYSSGDEQLDEYITLLLKYLQVHADGDAIAVEDLLQELDDLWSELSDEQCEKAKEIVGVINNDRADR